MKHKIKTITTNQGVCKVRLVPWLRINKNYVWLFSFGCGKSKRQLNDWLNKKLNKRAKKLSNQLSGISGLLPHGFAIRQLRAWIQDLKEGDSIFFTCESKEKLKQFDAYTKWFTRHEAKNWYINEEFLLFQYIKPPCTTQNLDHLPTSAD